MVLVAGCHPRPLRVPLEPIGMREAIGIVNDNIGRITGTLRASGFVDGRLTLSNGRSGGFHLDATLFFLAPKYVRLDLKRFGDRKLLLGSNSEYYWYYDKESDEYHCGRHDEDGEFPSQIPVQPRQFIDALGLTPIPIAEDVQRVQRVVDEYQQILFLEYDDRGNVRLQKEYWLDRYRPRLIRRVIFRDPEGVVEMESQLAGYKALARGGPLLPHAMTAEWPKKGARLRFRVSRWRLEEAVGPDSAQFIAPEACRAAH